MIKLWIGSRSRVLRQLKNKKPTVSTWNLSAGRVFPVDDSARVESFTVCLLKHWAIAIIITGSYDFDHRLEAANVEWANLGLKQAIAPHLDDS